MRWTEITNEASREPEGSAYYRGQIFTAPKPLRERPGFEEWFAGSKVHDEHGDPLMAFHGSFERFTEFKLVSDNRRAYGFNRLGFWFDIDPRTPEYSAGMGDDRWQRHGTTTGGVMPCVLSIKKPFYLDSEFLFRADAEGMERLDREHIAWQDAYVHHRTDDLGNMLGPDGNPLRSPDGKLFDYRRYRDITARRDAARHKLISVGQMGGDRIDGFDTPLKQLPKGAKSSDAEVDAFRNELIAEGHDGIFLGDTAADFASREYRATDWWIAFYPHQIKSIHAKSFTNSNDIMR